MTGPRRTAPSNREAPVLVEPAVLYADDTVLAVDKPAGIIVHGDGTGASTLTDAVRQLLADEGRERAAEELQALMRLDRDTTGIVLFSLSKATQPLFDRLIAERKIGKRYLAAVEGSPAWDRRTFDAPIGRDRHDSRKMRVSRTGKPSSTEASVLARHRDSAGRPIALLDVLLKTGRKHQIRVHLSAAGFPIMGDALYNPHAKRGAQLMLHASHMSFEHPLTGKHIVISTPYPARFARLDERPQ